MSLPAIVQQATATWLNTDPTKSVTLGSPVTAGHTLILGLTLRNYAFPGSSAVTDTLGNAWTRIAADGNNGQGGAAFYRCAASVAGTPTVTFSHSGSRYVSLWLLELDQQCPVQARWFVKTADTTVTVGLADTVLADCLALGVLSNEGATAASLAAGSGWTTQASIDLPNTTTTTLLGISKAIASPGAADPTWTQTGNNVVVAGLTLAPQTALLTNLTAATALDIGTIPSSFSFNIGLADQPDQEVWFKFTWTQQAYNLISYLSTDVSGVPLGVAQFNPRWSVLTGEPDALTIYSNQENWSAAVTTPLFAPTTTYYFQVDNANQPNRLLNGEMLDLAFVFSNTAAAPTGSILISDDSATYPFPYVILDPATGAVLQSAPFPRGERVGDLRDGSTLWNEISADGTLWLFDPTLGFRSHPSWIGEGAGVTDCPLTSDYETTYYACDPGDSGVPRLARVQALDVDGVAGAIWELPTTDITAIGVSRDNTVLYYSSAIASPPSKVFRWDLVNDVALSDLYAGHAQYRVPLDILVMTDTTILLRMRGVINNTNPSNVLRYSAAGSLLTTYPITKFLNRLAWAIEDDEFWAWEYLTEPTAPSTARFSRIAMSTGTVLETFTTSHSIFGMNLQNTIPGPFQYPNFSCPMTLIRGPGIPELFEDAAEPGSYGLTGFPVTLTVVPVAVTVGTRTIPQRRLRRAPHLADAHRWLTYDTFQLDMQTGVGLTTGQGADPQVMVRWSNDGGHTWSTEHWRTAGRQGARKTRVIVRQTGRARLRTFEVVVSDPVAWFLAAAYLEVTPGDGT